MELVCSKALEHMEQVHTVLERHMAQVRKVLALEEHMELALELLHKVQELVRHKVLEPVHNMVLGLARSKELEHMGLVCSIASCWRDEHVGRLANEASCSKVLARSK